MRPIASARDICGDILRQHYSLVRAAEFVFSPDMQAAWQTLKADWESLPLDEYLPGGQKYRTRRYGRFYFLPVTGELLPLPHADFFQSLEDNRVTGGMIRRFAPLLPETCANPFLIELIRFNFSTFPVDEAARSQPWQVDAHQIRVTADLVTAGQPTPEGIHRDSSEFVTVHLAELHHVAGGQVTIYDNAETPLTRFTLHDVMDSYYFNDQQVLHAVEAIHPADGQTRGLRGILTFDYHYRPGLERP